VIPHSLLKRFYSSDSSTAGTLSDKEERHPLTGGETLPAFLFWFAINIPLLLTMDGRAFYWRATLLGTVLGWIWVSLRF